MEQIRFVISLSNTLPSHEIATIIEDIAESVKKNPIWLQKKVEFSTPVYDADAVKVGSYGFKMIKDKRI